VADNLQMMERNACTLQERGKSALQSLEVPTNEIVTAISGTSSTRMTSSNSSPNTSLAIPNEVSLSSQDAVSM
jgi:hypothetical protein